MHPIRQIAKGRWKALVTEFGLSPLILDGKHHPCPICGGNDRFRFDDKNGMGTYICSQCGAGDGIMLLERVTKLPFSEIASKIEQVSGTITVELPKKEIDEAARKEAKNRLWSAGVSVGRDNPAGMYLFNRGLDAKPNKSLRFVDGVFHSTGSDKFPVMVAKICDAEGNPINLHITYLTRDGHKADVSPSRRIMSGTLPKGSAIRLGPVAEVMGIAEGIETALSASAMYDIPVWSSINANGLSNWSPPSGVKKVMIFADNDESFTGQKHSYDLANRLKCVNKLDVEVLMPESVGYDWNDVLWGSNAK